MRRGSAIHKIRLLILIGLIFGAFVSPLARASPDTLILHPDSAGTYQEWSLVDTTHYGATSDQSDATYVYVTGSTSLKETENLQDTTQTGVINSVTAYIKAKISGETTEYAQVTFVSAGSGSGTTGNPTPSYPSGLQANDLILLQVTVRDTTYTPITPSGFTLLYGPDSTGTGRQWIYYKFATGSESGTITITISGTSCKIARMYAFRNVATSSFTEGGGFGYATSATINAQSVTTTGVKRLAVSFVFVNDDNAVDSFTGESGGDWTEAVAEFTTTAGSDGCVQLQIATMVNAGTISGGSYTMSASDPWGVRAFALIPQGSNPTEQAVILWRTYNTDYESSAITVSRTAFTQYSETRTTNPYTGQAWTWSEVNALQIGSRASILGSGETMQVSEYWIVVDYTPSQTYTRQASLTNILNLEGYRALELVRQASVNEVLTLDAIRAMIFDRQGIINQVLDVQGLRSLILSRQGSLTQILNLEGLRGFLYERTGNIDSLLDLIGHFNLISNGGDPNNNPDDLWESLLNLSIFSDPITFVMAVGLATGVILFIYFLYRLILGRWAR